MKPSSPRCTNMRALLKLLIEKGVITKEEYLDQVKEEIRIARAEGRERFRKRDKPS